jgi:hypothetical protein
LKAGVEGGGRREVGGRVDDAKEVGGKVSAGGNADADAAAGGGDDGGDADAGDTFAALDGEVFGRGGEVERKKEKDVELALIDGRDLKVVETIEAKIRIADGGRRLGEDDAAATEVVAVVLGGGGGVAHDARWSKRAIWRRWLRRTR